MDSLGREWKGPSIEGVVSYSKEWEKVRTTQNRDLPFILTKSLFDSVDRFIALLIEKFAGCFPFWLAPEQIRILAIGDRSLFAKEVYQKCLDQGFRTQLDNRTEKLGVKIHEAEKEKVPCMIILGDKEQNKKMVTIRTFGKRNVDRLVSLESFFEEFQKERCVPLSLGESKH